MSTGLRIYVSDDINDRMCLNGDFLDLYNDETINITLKQTDIKEIGSNFGDYSNNFNIPATNRNNRVLKYWYDQFNDNQFSTGKVCSRIDIDGVFFRNGIITINSCDSDDNGNIKSYNIKFNTDIKSIKDVISNLKLSELPINNYDLKNKIQLNTNGVYIDGYSSNSLINDISDDTVIGNSPLVLMNKGYFDYQLNDVTTPNTNDLIDVRDLRPYVNLSSLFDVVSNYVSNNSNNSIKLDSDLEKLLSITNLHLNKHLDPYLKVEFLPLNNINFSLSGNTISNDEFLVNNFFNYITITKKNVSAKRTMQFDIFISTTTTNTIVPYKLFIQELVLNNDGSINENETNKQDNQGYVSSSEFITGNTSIRLERIWREFSFNNSYNNSKKSYRFVIESKGNILFSNIQLKIRQLIYQSNSTSLSPFSVGYYVGNLSSFNIVTQFNLPKNIPDIDAFGFLDSVMKLFNCVLDIDKSNYISPTSQDGSLVGEIEERGKNIINKIIPYNWWLKKGNRYDITKYVSRKVKQSKLKSFNKYNFKHSNVEYYSNFLYKEGQSNKREYGDFTEEIRNSVNDGEFKIESKFTLLNYYPIDNLPSIYTQNSIDMIFPYLQMSTLLDSSYDKPIVNKPIIMATNRVEFVYDNENNEYLFSKSMKYRRQNGTSVSQLVNFPSNTLYIPSSWKNEYINFDTLSLSFSKENDKGFLQQKNLYTEFYENIIFKYNSPYSREYEYEGYIPINIIQKLKLNDRLIIGNQTYLINELLINLNTSNVKLKLHNVVEEEVVNENLVDTTPPLPPTSMSTTYDENNNSFTIVWSGATDIIGNVYSSGINGYELSYSLNGGSYITFPYITENNSSHIYTTSGGYTTSGTYQFRVRVKDNSDNWSTDYTYSSIMIADFNIPTAPRNISTIPNVTKINLIWSGASDDISIQGYEISYSTDNINWTIIPFITSSLTSGDYMINDLSGYTFYYIRIRVKDGNDNWSTYKETTSTTLFYQNVKLSSNSLSVLDVQSEDCDFLDAPSVDKYLSNDVILLYEVVYNDYSGSTLFNGNNFYYKITPYGSQSLNIVRISTQGVITEFLDDYCAPPVYSSYRSIASIRSERDLNDIYENEPTPSSFPFDACFLSIPLDDNYKLYHIYPIESMLYHNVFYSNIEMTTPFNGQGRWWHIDIYYIKIDTIGRILNKYEC